MLYSNEDRERPCLASSKLEVLAHKCILAGINNISDFENQIYLSNIFLKWHMEEL